MNSKELLFDSFSADYVTIGKLRFLRYHDVLGGELEGMDQTQRRQTQAMLSFMTLAKRISDAKNVPYEEVQAKLMTNDVNNCPWLAEFSEEAFMMLSTMPIASEIESQMITLFIQSRAEIEGPDGWQPLRDWTLEDSRRLPGRFRQKVVAFIRQEQAGEEPAAEAGAAGKGKAKASAS